MLPDEMDRYDLARLWAESLAEARKTQAVDFTPQKLPLRLVQISLLRLKVELGGYADDRDPSP